MSVVRARTCHCSPSERPVTPPSGVGDYKWLVADDCDGSTDPLGVELRANPQADNTVHLIGPRSEHQDRHGAVLPQPAGHPEAVELRKHDVEHDQIRTVARGFRCRLAIAAVMT